MVIKIVRLLAKLRDVLINSPQDNQVLGYDAASSKWTNQTITAAQVGSYTSAEVDALLGGKAPAAHTHPSADITDATQLNQPNTIVKRDATGAVEVEALAANDTLLANTLIQSFGFIVGDTISGNTVNATTFVGGGSQITDLQSSALTGTIPSNLLPALAITETYEVASQAAMLALTAQRGDIAIRSDENKSYVLSTDDPTQVANWKLLKTPSDAVLSVNGQTGVVTLSASSVGAYTTAQVDTLLAGKANASHFHAISDVTNLQTTLDGKAASSHTHAAADVTSGVFDTGRLGSGTASAAVFLRGDSAWGIVPIRPSLTTNKYYAMPWPITLSTAATIANSIAYQPVYFTGDSVTRIGIEVTAASAAGTKARLGIYADANGRPGALISDIGEVTTDSTGNREITGSWSLTGWHWLACILEATPTVRSLSTGDALSYAGRDASSNNGAHMREAQSYGALPANANPSASGSAVPVIWYRKV